VSDDSESWTRVNRRCPHCGVRSQTLGTRCPACGRSYTPLGLLDRIPIPGDGDFTGRTSVLWLLAAICAVVLLVLLFVKSWVAGTLVLAALFVALVVAIGISNWLADR
jgi:hypothetical protein